MFIISLHASILTGRLGANLKKKKLLPDHFLWGPDHLPDYYPDHGLNRLPDPARMRVKERRNKFLLEEFNCSTWFFSSFAAIFAAIVTAFFPSVTVFFPRNKLLIFSTNNTLPVSIMTTHFLMKLIREINQTNYKTKHSKSRTIRKITRNYYFFQSKL